MSNILLWKELAARHERLRESSKKEGGKNWSKAQTGLGQEPGERGRAVPTTTAPDLGRERLLSRVHFSTKLVLAAASTEGRWAPCRGAPSFVGKHPHVSVHSAQSRCCTEIPSQGWLSPSPKELRSCPSSLGEHLPSSVPQPRLFLESRALAQALACFCLSRYSNPGSGQSSPHVNVQPIPARSSCSWCHFPVAEFLFALNFQPSEAFFCCTFSVLLRAPPTIYSLGPLEPLPSLLLLVLTPFQPSASSIENPGKNIFLAALC